MTNLQTETKRQILASQIALKRSKNNEEKLANELGKFFRKLKEQVLSALDEYWSEYQLLQGHVDLICSPIHESHKEYYEIIEKYKKREYKLGISEAKRLVKNAVKQHKQALKSEIIEMPISGNIEKDKLFGTLPSAEEDMLNKTFTASERTLSRVDSQINQIITDGYRSGHGINSVANDITRRFNQLETWESRRIARTEVHGSHNQGVMDTYQDLGVEYTQWIAADDDRTRDSHLEIDGEIIAMGDTYSNGLQFPGDTSGDIEEWINCRCSNAPFVVPYGYMAPPFSPFREDDLIPIESKNPLEQMEEQQAEPTPVESMEDAPYQLNNRENSFSEVKITQEQFENVIAHQSKRENAKLEFGNSIDNATGNLIHSKDIRGKKNTVKIPTSNRSYSVLHNHTNDGGFSGGDAYSHLMGRHQEVCYATTPKGVWIMRDTSQATFSKKEGLLTENSATELKYKMEGKYRELAKESKEKYQSQYDNAKTKEEKEKVRQQLNNEVFTNYNNWLLEEFAVGKRRDWLIEIEFIPKEKLKDVQF